MLSDPQFWVAIAFVIFVIAVFKPVRKILSSSLDNKIQEIKNSIEEAEDLKNDTQIILSDIKKRQNEVQKEIKEIHENAKVKIKNLESLAEEKLTDQISKKEVLAKAKIDQMSKDTKTLIQQSLSKTAIQATIIIIEKKLNQEEKQNLINQSIKELDSAIKY